MNLGYLCWVIQEDCSEFMKDCLKVEHFDPTFSNHCAIRIAAEACSTKVLRLLLEDGRIDPSATSDDPAHTNEKRDALQIAADCGHTEIVKILLQDDRVNPSVRDNYPIKQAADKGHFETVIAIYEHMIYHQDEKIRDNILTLIDQYEKVRHMIEEYESPRNIKGGEMAHSSYHILYNPTSPKSKKLESPEGAEHNFNLLQTDDKGKEPKQYYRKRM